MMRTAKKIAQKLIALVRKRSEKGEARSKADRSIGKMAIVFRFSQFAGFEDCIESGVEAFRAFDRG
jgi:hypothetical protein